MGLLGINGEDGKGVRKPEYITLRQTICSDNWMAQTWAFKMKRRTSGQTDLSLVSFCLCERKRWEVAQDERESLHGTRRNRHCRLACVCNLHRNANRSVQAAGRKTKVICGKEEQVWETTVNQSHVTALPCLSVSSARKQSFSGIFST